MAIDGGNATIIIGGKITLKCKKTNGQPFNIIFYDVVLIPSLLINLLSTGKLKRVGIVFDGINDRIVVKDYFTDMGKINWKFNVAILNVFNKLEKKDNIVYLLINYLVLVVVDYGLIYRYLIYTSVDRVI